MLLKKSICKFAKLLLLIKIFAIGFYWLIHIQQQQFHQISQLHVNVNVHDNNFTILRTRKRFDNVNFIKKKKLVKASNNSINNTNFNSYLNLNIDFIRILHQYEIEDYTFSENLTCFRNGIELRETETADSLSECYCLPEWHNKECSQPEIIWRALMTSKVPILQHISQTALINTPNRIILMITGIFLTLDLLEIQLLELKNCVDYFIICHQFINNETLIKNSNYVNLKKNLKTKFNNDFINNRIILISKCMNLKLAYNKFKLKILNDQKSLKLTDLFIICNEDELLNFKAIKFLQYYNIYDNIILKFRLKYNVFGFYWQHPNITHLNPIATTIKNFEKHFNSNPTNLQKYNINKYIIIIGDLNHFGGWYCRYCYQPSDIIQKIIYEEINNHNKINKNEIAAVNNNDNEKFPISNKNHEITINYIENLIAHGKYIDGKINLIKLNKYNDKYYTPESVKLHVNKFDYLFSNLYILLNDDSNDYDYK